MWLFCLSLCWFQEAHHFVDGTEFLLIDGTLIKTVEPVTEDGNGYNWREDGFPITLSRSKIRSVNYFTLDVPGPAPIAKTLTSAQQRSNPQGIHFLLDGRLHLKVLHQDHFGQSLEGRFCPMRARSLYEESRGEQVRIMVLEFETLDEAFSCVLNLYSLTGQPLKMVPIEIKDLKAANKAIKKSKFYSHAFELPGNLDLSKIGLAELTLKPLN